MQKLPSSMGATSSKRFWLLGLMLLPLFVSAQDIGRKDLKKIMETVCNDKIFTKVQTLPSIKEGETILSDSLMSYLKNNNVRLKDGKATFKFLVTKNSQIWNIEKVEGEITKEKVFKQGLLYYENMWTPAVVNSYSVCALLYLDVEFNGDKIILTRKPYDRTF